MTQSDCSSQLSEEGAAPSNAENDGAGGQGSRPSGAEPVRKLSRWWCSWRGPDGGIWEHFPTHSPPPGWLGVRLTGYGDDYSTIVGWLEADGPEACARLVETCWPEWDGMWRIDPEAFDGPLPIGGRFELPDWSPARTPGGAA